MMIKKGFLTFFIMLLAMQEGMANEPLLIDVKIIGASQSPLFDPQNFQLDLNQDYMLVIANNSHDAITFEFGTFGQKVLTRSIQGTSSMTQSSLVINGHSKVQWHFSPQVAGEYTYFAINTGLNSRGTPGKVIVKQIELDAVKEQTDSVKLLSEVQRQRRTGLNR
ncbi:MAG: hypothetical protein JSS07_00370 [Proteobacteria bacterium]|nr:hypothetical protein [Pseudomonadota bacterium]